VDIGPLFQQPEEAARMASENDVHVWASVSLAEGTNALVQLSDELKKIGREDHHDRRGRSDPAADYDFSSQGAAAVFGPRHIYPDAAKEMLTQLNQALR